MEREARRAGGKLSVSRERGDGDRLGGNKWGEVERERERTAARRDENEIDTGTRQQSVCKKARKNKVLPCFVYLFELN